MPTNEEVADAVLAKLDDDIMPPMTIEDAIDVTISVRDGAIVRIENMWRDLGNMDTDEEDDND